MQSANGEPGGFRGDPAAGRAGFEVTKRVLFLAFLIGSMTVIWQRPRRGATLAAILDVSPGFLT